MFKKIVIASAILATSSSLAFADATPYVGANLGLNSNNFKLKSTTSTNTNFNSRNFTGGVFAGVGSVVSQNIYLGGEAFFNEGSVSTSTKNIDNAGTTARIKMGYNFGADFMPGYMVNESSMIYAKLGVARANVRVTQTPVQPSTLVSGSTSNTVTGGQLGLGLQSTVAKNIAVRGEFVHTAYGTFNANGNKIKPYTNTVNVGLVYKFD